MIVSDSHGRGVGRLLEENFSTANTFRMKPGLCFEEVTNGVTDEKRCNLVLVAGANDVYKNESINFLLRLYAMLPLLSVNNKRVIIATIPLRYDLPSWSCVNKEIRKVNKKIRFMCCQYKNIRIASLDDFSVEFFGKPGKPGIHLNQPGKFKLTRLINSFLKQVKPDYVRDEAQDDDDENLNC